jgi:hypothetical protein
MGFLFTLMVVTLISANQNPGVVGAKLAKEIVAGRIVGPFPPPFQFQCFSFGGCA